MLPQEIILDILTQLPAKSVGRFRCVSKQWKSLLSQPHFIKTHLNRSKQLSTQEESLILYSRESQSLYTAELKNVYNLPDKITILAKEFRFDDPHFDSIYFNWNMASCNGLILVEDQDEELVLINPTTKEITELPCFPLHLRHNCLYGLGYDFVSDDYKVVFLSYGCEDDEPDAKSFVYVYSVKNGNWKRADYPYNHAAGILVSGFFVDGYIYWLAYRTSDYSPVITAFDLEEEKFSELPYPSSADSDELGFDYLGTLGGRLCMFHLCGNDRTDTWVMKLNGVEVSWTKFTNITLGDSVCKPICLLGKEQVVVVKDEDTVDERLLVYNLEEGAFKDIVVHGIEDRFYVISTFVESLVSPHCGDDGMREDLSFRY